MRVQILLLSFPALAAAFTLQHGSAASKHSSLHLSSETFDGGFELPSFDVVDKSYQVSDEYAPDKASTWAFPVEKDGWTLAHNSLRDEMRDMVEALQAVKKRGPISDWELACIQSAWKAHYEHIHAHHTNEDTLLAPFLGMRFKVPPKIGVDHEELEASLERMDKLVSALSAGDVISGKMMKAITDYEVSTKAHFKEEEETSLRLTRSYFTQKELAPKIQEILGNGPQVELGSFIDSCGVEYFRNEFMPQEGIPFFVWYIEFGAKHKVFLKEFKTPIQALKSGEEPVFEEPTSSSWFDSIKASLFGSK